MAAGFAMLESGLVRTKNTATICLKNIALYSVAGIMYYLVGYNLMYTDVGSYIGSFSFLYNTSAAELALLGADEATPEQIDAAVAGGYSVMSDWFFQMVFVATAASIVSGTLAERIKLWPFLIFVVVLTGFIYPIQGSWTWGGGWLSKWASPTSPARPSSTRSAAGRHWCRRDHPRRPQGQVRPRRLGAPDAGLQPAARHARHLHPLARLVRLQRRLAARHGHGEDASAIAISREHQPRPRPAAWSPR
jgi:hypothetical protein